MAGYLLNYNDDRGSRVESTASCAAFWGRGSPRGAAQRGPRHPGCACRAERAGAPPARGTDHRVLVPAPRGPASRGRRRDRRTLERVQTGGQIQGARPIANRWNVLYGYRLKNVSVTSEFLSSSHRVAGLDLSLLRDTRDNPVDARRGRFLSSVSRSRRRPWARTSTS